eukprot:12937912-Prorocentrum_lima.AAC.1
MGVEKCSHETTAGSGETLAEESSGSHQEPEDGAGFFDVKKRLQITSWHCSGTGLSRCEG